MNEKTYIGKIFLCFLITFSMIVGSYLILLSSEIESDESTDTEEKAIVLGGSGHPSQGGGKKDPADLKITDIFTIPSSPVGGESVTIYAKIENIGDLDVKVPFTSYLDIDGYWAATKYLDELVGGGYAYITKTVTLDPGYHELDAIADYWDDAKEADEGNNQRIENILWENPAPLPDIAAVDIWTSPASPIGGQFTTIYFKISTNSVAFSQTVDTELYYDGDWKVTKHLYGSTGSATYIYSHSIILAAGIHEIKMITDSANAVVESSESNNQRIENILWQTPTPYPDLIVTSIVVYNEVTNGILSSVYSGWPVRISVSVKNNGDAAAGASVVELRDILGGSPTVMGTANVPALAIGATYTATFDDKYISSTGTHTIRAIADSTGAVTESVESNNIYDKTNFVVSLSSWTVGIYMDADSYLDPNEGTLMEPWAIGDITEMQLAGGTSYGSLNIIILIDMFDGEGVFPSTAGVYIVQGASVYQIANLGEVNMGDPANLNSFLCTHSIGRFKASQSMLVLWGHGGGCVGGIFEDEHVPSGDNYMSIPDLGIALHPYYGAHIDILAFDSCLMSCLEVGFEAYYEASNADIVVGFEEVVYADGFPYGCSASYSDGIFNYMRANPTASDVTVAYEMVERTYQSYQNGGSQNAADDYDTYLSVAAYYNHYGYPDHGDLEDIAYEIGNVGYILYNDEEWWPAYYARHDCDDFAQPIGGSGWVPVSWDGMYVDIYDFMWRLKYNADYVNNMDLYYACQDVIDALFDARIHSRTGYYHNGCYGLSLYFPWSESDRDTYASDYDALAMTQYYWAWNQFTDEYPYSPY